MHRQCLGIAAGWLIALACAHAQTSNDCWTVRLGSIDRQLSVSDTLNVKRDSGGNMYALRSLPAGFACTKFDPAGNEVWERSFSPTNGSVVSGTEWVIDANGAVFFATGVSSNYAGEHVEVVVMRFDAEGNRTWLSRFNSRGFWHRLVVDAAGNAFVTGVNFGGAVNGTSIQVQNFPFASTKLGADGNGVWCSQTNSMGPYEPPPPVLATGRNGHLYAAWSANEDYDRVFVTARISPDGMERWRRSYVGYNLWQPYALLVDDDGNAFTTGSQIWGAPEDTHVTIKYSAEGAELWDVAWPGGSEPGDFGTTALDNAGNLYIALGLTRWDDRALLTAKFDAEGNRLWTIYENGRVGEHYRSVGLSIDTNEDVLVTSLYYSTNDLTRMTIRYVQNTIRGLPIIRRQPIGGRVRAGSTVSLEVLATGLQPLAYKWRLDGSDIPGETNGVLVLSNIGTNQSGTYAVLITNAAGCALSLAANITVVEIPPFRFGPPTLTQTIFQQGDGSWATNHYVQMLLTGGRLGWPYTMEYSSNLVHWLPSLTRGVDSNGSALFLFWRQGQSSMFFRASTRP